MSESNTNTNDIRTYIRQGVAAEAASEARFSFEETEVILYFAADGTLQLRKLKADGEVGKTVVGEGRWHIEEINKRSEEPNLRGTFGTKRGSFFEVAGWYMERDGDEFYSAVIRPKLVRNGFLPKPKFK